MLFTISAIGAALPSSVTQFVVARILGGLGIGMASMLSPLYIAEVAPARIRGRMVSLNQLAIVSGMVVVYYVNSLIANLGDNAWNVAVGWRWMFASGALPAVLFFVLLFLVPESPRWLTERGREPEALAILERVGGREEAAAQMQEIRAVLAQESGSLGQLFERGMRRPLGDRRGAGRSPADYRHQRGALLLPGNLQDGRRPGHPGHRRHGRRRAW